MTYAETHTVQCLHIKSCVIVMSSRVTVPRNQELTCSSFKVILFMYLFLAVQAPHCFSRTFSSCREWGYSSLWYKGFSVWWLFLSQSMGSRCEGSCSSSCSSQALEHGLKNLRVLCLAPGFPKHSCKVLSFVEKYCFPSYYASWKTEYPKG